MKKTIYVLLFGLYMSLHAFAQSDPKVSITDIPKISVVGIGTVTTFPNAAQITLVVKFVKSTLREAVNENQKTSAEVLAVIKNYVADTTDIKISLIATDKVMRYDNALKKEVFVGFESSQNIIFTLKDLAEMQNFTESILKTKIYEIARVSYFHTDAANFVKQAQEIAVADAIETTQRLAKSANIKLGKVIYMQTNSSPSNTAANTVNSQSFQAFSKSMGGEGVSSSGQLINYTVNVTMYTRID